MTAGALLFLGFIALQRLAELALARRNTVRLLAAGATEHGAGHYPAMVALHAGWLAALAVLGHDAALRPGWLGLFALLQVLRVWIIASLGRRWTTRIIVTGAPLVRRGPFRWLRHPNYALVAIEIPVASLVLGLGGVALVFGLLNLALLGWRIRVEDRALAPHRAPPAGVSGTR